MLWRKLHNFHAENREAFIAESERLLRQLPGYENGKQNFCTLSVSNAPLFLGLVGVNEQLELVAQQTHASNHSVQLSKPQADELAQQSAPTPRSVAVDPEISPANVRLAPLSPARSKLALLSPHAQHSQHSQPPSPASARKYPHSVPAKRAPPPRVPNFAAAARREEEDASSQEQQQNGDDANAHGSSYRYDNADQEVAQNDGAYAGNGDESGYAE